MPKIFTNAKSLLDLMYDDPDKADQIQDKNSAALDAISEDNHDQNLKIFRIAAGIKIAYMALEEVLDSCGDEAMPPRRTAHASLKRIKALALNGWQKRSDGSYLKKIEDVSDILKAKKMIDWLSLTTIDRGLLVADDNPPLDNSKYLCLPPEFGEVLKHEQQRERGE